MRKLWVLVAVAGVLVACDEPVNSCDEYVDYMCDCHPEVDCAELETSLANATSEVQDQCVIDLREHEDADATAGTTCP